MFTWICPQCGREVPPSASECPACAEARAAAARPPAPAAPPPTPPQYQAAPQYPQAPPPPPQYQQVPPQYAQPQYQPPQQQYAPPQPQFQQQYPAPPAAAPAYVIQEPKKGLPSWLIALLVTAVIGGGLFGVYKIVGSKSNGAPANKAELEQVGAAPAGGGGIYDKFVEVTAFRLLEDSNKKPKVRFTVVNHSNAPMSGLEMQVSLGRKGEDSEPPFAVVDAKIGSIEPNGTAEVEFPIKTTLRVYELPDWQFIKGTFVVKAPK